MIYCISLSLFQMKYMETIIDRAQNIEKVFYDAVRLIQYKNGESLCESEKQEYSLTVSCAAPCMFI